MKNTKKMSKRLYQLFAIILFVAIFGPLFGTIIWVFFRPDFVPSSEWIRLVKNLPIGLGLVVGLISIVFVQMQKKELESAVSKNDNLKSYSPDSESLPLRIIYAAFGLYVMVSSYEIMIFEVLPYMLSHSHKRPSIEHVEVESHVQQQLGHGFRLVAANGYERLVPMADSRILFCINKGWSLELYGMAGRWGLHLEQLIARKTNTSEWIKIDYVKELITAEASCN